MGILSKMEKVYRSGISVFQSKTPIVGVYGVTSVGKSTFLNSLVKSDEFKVGMGETTKIIHIIKDMKNQKKINFGDVSIEVEYIFKDMPLLSKFSLIDVPGTNKSFSDDDINSIIKKLDVIIWIFDIHGDISPRDRLFLENVIVKKMVKTVVILNKIDSGIDDINFNNVTEKNEFLEDVVNRKNSIVDFFKKSNAEDLLVTILPISAKKLLNGVTKHKKQKFEKQHEEIINIITHVSNSAFVQKEIFRDGFDKIKEKARKEIERSGEIFLYNKSKKINKKLTKISDNRILSKNLKLDFIINKDMSEFSINNYYKNDLKKLNNKIKEII